MFKMKRMKVEMESGPGRFCGAVRWPTGARQLERRGSCVLVSEAAAGARLGPCVTLTRVHILVSLSLPFCQ
jgi:hypothetical protein